MSLTFLITAGPTQESLDPVRYLTNRSTGKMGYALAEAAIKKGHRVILVSGPTQLKAPAKVEFHSVISAQDMYQVVMKEYLRADVIIKVAAVADYRPAKISKQKIKKKGEALELKLIPNPDILKTLGRKKKAHQTLVGFAAETRNGLSYAKKKLKEKNCDWIILNDVSQTGIGFGSQDNEVILLSRSGEKIPIGKTSKKNLANQILKTILP